MTCAHFGWDQICTQVDASFSPFGHPIQVNTSQVTSINLLLANEIEDSLLWNIFICDLRVLARKLASPFGHPTQVSTQVQLASTCDYLLVRLTRALQIFPFHFKALAKRSRKYTQAENLGLLATSFGQALRALALTCVDLRWLAHNLVAIKFARKSKQVYLRLATQPKSTQVKWRPLAYY